eukprot:2965704-Amphidinium_carterae.2
MLASLLTDFRLAFIFAGYCRICDCRCTLVGLPVAALYTTSWRYQSRLSLASSGKPPDWAEQASANVALDLHHRQRVKGVQHTAHVLLQRS